jgi:hypothetical protein
MLIEDRFQTIVKKGVIQYADRSITVPFDPRIGTGSLHWSKRFRKRSEKVSGRDAGAITLAGVWVAGSLEMLRGTFAVTE